MTIKLRGSTDGSVSLTAPADTSPTGTDITFTLPTDAGSANQFIKNSGTAGTLDYSSMVETSTGIGIGTSAPATPLHVKGTGATPVVFESTNSQSLINFRNSSTTLFYMGASSNNWNVQTSGVERLSITTAGNVGINTTSPGAQLEVKNTGNVKIYADASGGYIEQDISNLDFLHLISRGKIKYQSDPNNGTVETGHIFECDGAEKVRIDSSGDVQIGTTAPFGGSVANRGHLTLNGTNDFKVQWGVGGTERGYLYADATNLSIINTQNGYLRFNTNNTERMRIHSDGVVSVNTSAGWFSRYFLVESTSSGGGTAGFLASNNSIFPVSVCNYASSGDNNLIGFWTDSRSSPSIRGEIDYNRSAGQVRYNVTSDRRLKSNIEPAESAINLLSSIQVRSYTWTESQYKVEYGFVAQELHDHVPDAVKQGDDGDEVVDAWSIDNSKLVPVLTKALQEAIAKIETLETKVAALEAA